MAKRHRSSPTPDSEERGEESWRSKAELYEVGLLEGDEKVEFERAVSEGNRAAVEALEGARALAASIGLAAPAVGSPAVAAPARAKERLLAAVRAEAKDRRGKSQLWKQWAADSPAGAKVIVGKDDGGWEETDVAGIRVRRLFVDPVQKMATMLVRMEPGTRYPGHRHAASEECYVIEGDIHVGERRMTAGDYQWAGTGSQHAIQSTKGGCLLLIRSSLSDELLD